MTSYEFWIVFFTAIIASASMPIVWSWIKKLIAVSYGLAATIDERILRWNARNELKSGILLGGLFTPKDKFYLYLSRVMHRVYGLGVRR